jgi:cellulose synthase/poly-beta-1,6-N-acetylglucosamine synthase-like glycosyltransferase
LIIAISVTLFFLVLRFTVTLFNFISNPKLPRITRPYNNFVSILIPIRNEKDKALALLESIYRQDYKNYEVIIYDDDSGDGTYEVCIAFAAKHQGFSVVKGAKLPEGWTGKNYACHQLAQRANGEYFLFVDANTIIKNGLINSAVHRMHVFKLALLSLLPNQAMHTGGENTTVPLLHYLFLNLLPLRLIYLAKSAGIATAWGQFMFFDAAIYRQNQWHQLVMSKVIGDADIMKLVKSAAYNGDLLLGNGMVTSRMYPTYPQAISGFGKTLLAAFDYSIIGLLVYILLVIGDR